MSPVLVVAAVPQELQDFKTNGRRGIERLITGMGRRAGEAVRRRLLEGDVGLVVSTGFAGATRPGFKAGDLVMASEVIHGSSGERRHPGASFPELSGLAGRGPFLTVDRVLSDPNRKSDAGKQFGAIAVDLESAAVAQAADRAGVAWVALRAILDPMELPLRITSRAQALSCLAVPRRWSEFSAFLRAIRTASRSLGKGLQGLLEKK